MTKKQIAALERIMKREFRRRNTFSKQGKHCKRKPGDEGFVPMGFYPSEKGCVITDGYVAIHYPKAPEGIDASVEMRFVSRILLHLGEQECVISIKDDQLKAKDYRAILQERRKDGAEPTIDLESVSDSDIHLTGCFSIPLIIDVLEALGNDTLLYIGKYSEKHSCLIALPEDYMENDNLEEVPFGIVLPIIKRSNQ